jgi:lauroyl/myristoyl acyltransferase
VEGSVLGGGYHELALHPVCGVSRGRGRLPLSILCSLASVNILLTYYAFVLVNWIAPRLPKSVGYGLCDFAGEIGYRLGRSARKAVRANLRHVLGRQPPDAVVREAFRSQARTYFETFVIPSLTAQELPRWATVEGVEHLEAALSLGRGVILAGMHLGNPSLAAQALAERGWGLRVVVEPIEPPALHDLITRLRTKNGVEMIPLNEPSIARRLIRELRGNNILGLMLDRELTGNGALIPFFGQPAMLSVGPATLALATGAVICPSLTLRRDDGRVHGIIDPAIDFTRSSDRESDILALTLRIVERFEYYIGQAPGQWTLFVPVWNRPSGVPAVLRHTTT